MLSNNRQNVVDPDGRGCREKLGEVKKGIIIRICYRRDKSYFQQKKKINLKIYLS